MLPQDERPYSYCPLCGGDLELRTLKTTEPGRLVCIQCGFIFYLDPKVAVGTIITRLTRNGQFGASVGVLRTVMDIGQTIGPVLTGFLVAVWGYGVAFPVLAGVAAAAVAADRDGAARRVPLGHR